LRGALINVMAAAEVGNSLTYTATLCVNANHSFVWTIHTYLLVRLLRSTFKKRNLKSLKGDADFDQFSF